jgi:hypothetical protein
MAGFLPGQQVFLLFVFLIIFCTLKAWDKAGSYYHPRGLVEDPRACSLTCTLHVLYSWGIMCITLNLHEGGVFCEIHVHVHVGQQTVLLNL